MTVSLIVGASGHRPDKLGGYGRYDQERFVTIAREALRFYGATRAVCRLAQGWDQSFANACIDLGIPYDVIVPFPGEDARWPERAQRAYTYLMGRAASIHTISLNATCANAHYQSANMEVVNRCDLLLTMWSGAPGGTANTIRYAAYPTPTPMVDLWSKWDD